MKKTSLFVLFFIFYSVISYSQTDDDKEKLKDCDCYFAVNCGSKTGGKVPGPICEYKCNKEPKSKNDGYCRIIKSTYSYNMLFKIAKFVDNVFLAVEQTGKKGGGVIDDKLIFVSHYPDIPNELYVEIKGIITGLFIPLTIGLTEYANTPHRTGFYSLPDDILDINDFGSVEALNKTHLTVMSLVRQALVTEISSPGSDNFELFLDRISFLAPDYEAFGRCEYPHPLEHGHDFPFMDGLDCMRDEIYSGVDQIVSVPCLNNTTDNIFACHNGRSICIPKIEERKHIHHGDLVGKRCLKNSTRSNDTINNLELISLYDMINVYPNPAKSSLNIESYVYEGVTAKFELYNIYGKVVYSNQLNGSDSFERISIDISNFPYGLYVLKSDFNGVTKMKKIRIIE